MNTFTLTGIVETAVTMKPAGRSQIGTFRIRETRRVYDKETKSEKQETAIHELKAWGKRAENIAQYCPPGTFIAVQGYIKSREYQGRYYCDLEIENYEFGGGSPRRQTTQATAPQRPAAAPQRQAAPAAQEPPEEEPDVPFTKSNPVRDFIRTIFPRFA